MSQNKSAGQHFDFYLGEVIKEIKKKYRPERIILFGSAARGQTKKWSDADLVIIKNTDKKFYDRIEEVSLLVDHLIPLDILVYTPKELREMTKWNYFIQNEVLAKGKVLYEA